VAVPRHLLIEKPDPLSEAEVREYVILEEIPLDEDSSLGCEAPLDLVSQGLVVAPPHHSATSSDLTIEENELLGQLPVSLAEIPYVAAPFLLAKELALDKPQLIILSEVYIIDFRVPNREEELNKGCISFFIKPCNFFLYCFLVALRMFNADLPPIGSWAMQLYSEHSHFIHSRPDYAAVDRCIFGNEKVFSRGFAGCRLKKKLVFEGKPRRSPRLSNIC